MVVVAEGGRWRRALGRRCPLGCRRNVLDAVDDDDDEDSRAEGEMDKLQKGKVALGPFRSYIPVYLILKINKIKI